MALPRRSLNVRILLVAIVGLAVGLAVWALSGRERQGQLPPLGLFSTLPIYWGEARDLSGVVDGTAQPHWARAAIERERRLQPLDLLDADRLQAVPDLLIAQPRALSPAENVALDDWVRGGGHVLLFADPMLTAASPFPIGDPRRPQDVTLLSPILARWGLRLTFDEAQPEGERMVEVAGGPVPVDLAGHFEQVPTAPDAPAACGLEAGGVLADCRIGRGRALIVADAALLDGRGEDPDGRTAALSRLMKKAFSAD